MERVGRKRNGREGFWERISPPVGSEGVSNSSCLEGHIKSKNNRIAVRAAVRSTTTSNL